MNDISDFFTSTELIPKKRLGRWINRPGFGIRKVVILKWIVLGNILTLGYKKSLLSSLIQIRYEDSIDNIRELDISEMPLLLAKSTSLQEYVERDPRQSMARIVKRKILFSIVRGQTPGWALAMYDRSMQRYYNILK